MVCLAVFAYLLLVMLNVIKKENRLGTTDIFLLGSAGLFSIFLLQPETIQRFSQIEAMGVKLSLRDIQLQQHGQQKELEQLRLILPLLLPEKEQAHLRHLAQDGGEGYEASSSLRTQLRRLSTIKLIQRKEGHSIHELKDGKSFKLSDYVELTNLGRQWLQRLAELDAPDTAANTIR